ncbi:MAG TPA: M56 family metallopeptidase [Acetivibrio sp.]|uniref:M56 family metallopeptidase n=1 Tax=Acetivibrio sp. TaxID=1872092 RepID=UPI002D06314F|nr:M56 family metallopeptidase [Acetivibrio sp.]HOM02408.1 M56 family metallopeptidase [Acetivibrio sp.]
MTKLFELMLQNSFTGIIFILVILIIRKLTKNFSKRYVTVLWILLLAELLFTPLVTGPFNTIRNVAILNFNEGVYESSDSLRQNQSNYNSSNTYQQKDESNPIGNSNSTPADNAQGSRLDKDNLTENNITPSNNAGSIPTGKHRLVEYLSFVWLLGIIAFTVYFLIQYIKLRHMVNVAIKVDNNIWETSACDIPFVMPGIPSKIYIPAGLEGHQREDILTHEMEHIKHFDPWIKCMATVALTVHWFNPFVWIAFSLMGKDMEMYCDERVLRGKGLNEKRQYSQTILDFSKKASGFPLTIGFAKNNVENRIKHILCSKKPHRIMSIALAAVILACGVLFLTAGKKHAEDTYNQNKLNGTQRDIGEDAAEKTPASEKEEVSDNNTADDAWAENGEKTENQNSYTEDKEFWGEKLIVGTTFEPDSDLKKLILDAPDYANDFSSFHPVFEGDMAKNINLIGKTKHFLLYGTSDTESILVKTVDNKYILAEVPYTSNYMVQPLLNEKDFDGDGENELAIIIYVKHGTGCSIKTLFMVDKANGGKWYMYQLVEDEYLPQLEAKFDTVYTKDSIKLLFDSKYVGLTLPMDNEFRNSSVNYKFHAGMQIQIHFVEDRIELNADLAGYSDVFFSGEYTGHRINADIGYLGEGKWELKNFRYSDANIDSVIRDALTLYFTGQTEELNQYCMADGHNMKGITKKSNSVSVLDISYPVDNMDIGKVDAHATVRLDGSSSLINAAVSMKLTDSLTDTWKVTGIDVSGL